MSAVADARAAQQARLAQLEAEASAAPDGSEAMDSVDLRSTLERAGGDGLDHKALQAARPAKIEIARAVVSRGVAKYCLTCTTADGRCWTVAKRYSELKELKDKLRKMSPAVAALDFPKKTWGSGVSDSVVKQRKEGLGKWVSGVIPVLPEDVDVERELCMFLAEDDSMAELEEQEGAPSSEAAAADPPVDPPMSPASALQQAMADGALSLAEVHSPRRRASSDDKTVRVEVLRSEAGRIDPATGAWQLNEGKGSRHVRFVLRVHAAGMPTVEVRRRWRQLIGFSDELHRLSKGWLKDGDGWTGGKLSSGWRNPGFDEAKLAERQTKLAAFFDEFSAWATALRSKQERSVDFFDPAIHPRLRNVQEFLVGPNNALDEAGRESVTVDSPRSDAASPAADASPIQHGADQPAVGTPPVEPGRLRTSLLSDPGSINEEDVEAQMELLLAEAGEEAEAEAEALLREAKRAALERGDSAPSDDGLSTACRRALQASRLRGCVLGSADPWSLAVDGLSPSRSPSTITVRHPGNSTLVQTDAVAQTSACSGVSASPGDGLGNLRLRGLQRTDLAAYRAFGLSGLSVASRDLFGPFPWDADASELDAALSTAIDNHLSRRDWNFVVVAESGAIVGNIFLWSITEPVPELGIAIADEYHSLGLGYLLLHIAAAVAEDLGASAIELTTVPGNARAKRLYERCGYETLGVIRNPVGVDVTAAFAGEVVATKFCDEVHMAKVLADSDEVGAAVRCVLVGKQIKAERVFGKPNYVAGHAP